MLTKEEMIELLTEELKEADRDLACVEEELAHVDNEILSRELDQGELLLLYYKIIDRKLQIEEGLKNATV